MQKSHNINFKSGVEKACSEFRKTSRAFKKSCFAFRKTCLRGKSSFHKSGLRLFRVRVSSLIGGASLVGALLLTFLALNPTVSPVYAEENNQSARTAILGASTVSVMFHPTDANGSMTPINITGSKAKIDVTATIKVENSGGYGVYVGSSSSQLKNGSNVIDPVSSMTSYDSIPVNRWGYSFAQGTTASDSYSAMPATLLSSPLDSNNETRIISDTRTYTLSFAANINVEKPAGIYTNTVTMSVVSSPLVITNEFSVDTMQEMTSTVCSSATDQNGDGEITGQLKDTRDGKFYWVAKLADGNCWMTQNLDLDLSTSIALTPADSDVTSSWTPGYDTFDTVTTDTVDTSSQAQTRSWGAGNNWNYRITNPNISSTCGAGKSSPIDCKAQFTEYPGGTPTTANSDTVAHYLVGNYYQWNAATAGTGADLSNDEAGKVQASSSICPKGWRLPTSTPNGELNALVTALGGTASTNNITQAPFYGVRGGGISQNTDFLLNDAGNLALYWSSTPFIGSNNAFNLYFANTSDVYSSNHGPRQDALSVRCVARTGNEPTADMITYSITYEHYRSTGTLPDKQEAQSSADNYTFTIPATPSGLEGTNGCPINGWSLTQNYVGDYAPGSTITLTKDNPAVVLYPGSGAGYCAF